MGDAGEEADVLDDKMWLNEEDDMGEKPEGKNAGMAGESGAESCLKMVAGGEDEEQKQDSAANEAQRASEKDKVTSWSSESRCIRVSCTSAGMVIRYFVPCAFTLSNIITLSTKETFEAGPAGGRRHGIAR